MDKEQNIYIVDDIESGEAGGGSSSSTKYTVSGGEVTGGTIYVGTSSNPTSTSVSVVPSTKVYIKCVPVSGYTFNGWYAKSGVYASYSGKNLASGGYIVTTSSAVSISAYFTGTTYNAEVVEDTSFNKGDGTGNVYLGTSLGDEQYTSLNVAKNTEIYVKCVPDGSSKFMYWSVTGSVSASGTEDASGGYFKISDQDVDVTAKFVSYWENWESDESYRTIKFDDGEVDIESSDSVLTYEKITVTSGYTNSLVLCVSTITGDEGMFVSKSVPQNWEGSFSLVSSYNTLYKFNSYLSGYTFSGDGYLTLTLEDLPAGTYYVAYRYENNGNTLTVADKVARYKYHEEREADEGWFTDDEGYRRINRGTNTGTLLLYEDITVPNGYTGEIDLESSTKYDEDGIILTTEVPNAELMLNSTKITTLSPSSGVCPLYSNGSYATGYEGDTYNVWNKEISDITPGTYCVAARWNLRDIAGENWVRYKFGLVGNSYIVSFNVNGGSFTDGWGDTKGSGVMTKSVRFGTSSLSTVNKAEKTGYSFLGWYNKPEGGEQVYDSNENCIEGTYFTSQNTWKYVGNVILYAQYGTGIYYVEYNPNCNTSTGTMDKSTFQYNVSSTLSKNKFSRDGYEFKYWTLTTEDSGTTYGDQYAVKNLSSENGATVILYAQWTDLNEATEREIQLISDYNKMSANSIKYAIENSNVEYIRDSKSEEMYKIKIVDPDSIDTLDIFTVSPVMESNKNIISSMDITVKSDTNDLNLKIINRYSGYYNPIFKDILFYNDEGSYPFSHTSFASTYKDNLGKFGFIKNMWYHKVNNEDNSVLGTRTLQYPLTGEYALGFRDYNIFSTNWDSEYYTKQTGLNTSETCTNMESMKEGLCMFGSRYLNTPEYITLECFDNDDWSGEWNSEWISNTVGCPGEVMFKEINDNSVNFYFFIRKRLKRFFCDKLRDEFGKYIKAEYSYGDIETLDDDIEEYVEKNVLKLYELKKIRTFVKRTKRGVANSKIENEYGKYLDQSVDSLKGLGFIEINNVSLTKKSTDDFDRQLTYNLRNGEQEDFGFQILIKKI